LFSANFVISRLILRSFRLWESIPVHIKMETDCQHKYFWFSVHNLFETVNSLLPCFGPICPDLSIYVNPCQLNSCWDLNSLEKVLTGIDAAIYFLSVSIISWISIPNINLESILTGPNCWVNIRIEGSIEAQQLQHQQQRQEKDAWIIDLEFQSFLSSDQVLNFEEVILKLPDKRQIQILVNVFNFIQLHLFLICLRIVFF
jgi:hypothetical protein